MRRQYPNVSVPVSVSVSVLVSVLAVVSLACRAALALDPPHDSSNGVICSDCHSAHDPGQLVSHDAAQEALCRSCHNPTGPASAKTKVARHSVSAGALVLDCSTCHDPHRRTTSADTHPGGVTAPNLHLIRANLSETFPGALNPTVFQQRPAHFAINRGAPYNGICQSCHTETVAHRRDGSADKSHGVGSNCIECHAHENGFIASTCTTCHKSASNDGDGIPPAGRRAVAAEFVEGTKHGHQRAARVDNPDCIVCHAVDRHRSGTVTLVDPDGGAGFSFVLTSDFAGDPDLSTFCSHCHDVDGATRLASPKDPFGNGNVPPDVASKFRGSLQWRERYGDDCYGAEGTGRGVSSHHGISDADQAFGGGKIECTDCHTAHLASSTRPLINPDSHTEPWTAGTDALCLRCHGGGNGPTDTLLPAGVRGPTQMLDDTGSPCSSGPTCVSRSSLRALASCAYTENPWYVAYTWQHSAHGGGSKRPWPGYHPEPGSPAPSAEVGCTVCHDPHGSYTATNPTGNPYAIRDYVDGAPFVDDGARADASWNGPPWKTTGSAREVRVSVTLGADYATVDWGGPTGLCSACHQSWTLAHGFFAGCTGCQTCHGHGQAFGEFDWPNSGANNVACP